MRPKPGKLDKKHPQATRDALEDIQDTNIRYMEPNRDRALGEADRTGRHYDENAPNAIEAEGTEASKERQAD
jgi:hypothetical protein